MGHLLVSVCSLKCLYIFFIFYLWKRPSSISTDFYLKDLKEIQPLVFLFFLHSTLFGFFLQFTWKYKFNLRISLPMIYCISYTVYHRHWNSKNWIWILRSTVKRSQTTFNARKIRKPKAEFLLDLSNKNQ